MARTFITIRTNLADDRALSFICTEPRRLDAS
jgi:hypothetical protein